VQACRCRLETANMKVKSLFSFFPRRGGDVNTTNEQVIDAGSHPCDTCGATFGTRKQMVAHRSKTHKNVTEARLRVTTRSAVSSLTKEEIQDSLDRAEISDLLESMVSKVSGKNTGPNPFGTGRRGAATRSRVGTNLKVKKVQDVQELALSKGISVKEACAEYNVPNSLIYKWRKRRPELEEILKQPSKRFSRSLGSGRRPKFPEIEEKVHRLYVRRRLKGLKVRGPWWVAQAKRIARELNINTPTSVKFKCSPRWLSRFFRDRRISLRRRTNNHKLSMEERIPLAVNFLWKVRRIQRSAPAEGQDGGGKYGRFALPDIYNQDSVPLEDDEKDGS